MNICLKQMKSGKYSFVNLLSFGVIFSPDPLELVKMMWPQD